ncbi:hypothetical protein KM043_015366 [Ampulex compressa]|nr:hypothetical protein KM043_015366 [Ampulex compressa]
MVYLFRLVHTSRHPKCVRIAKPSIYPCRILPTDGRDEEGEKDEGDGTVGGCNYIAGGCEPIARTLGLPNWSIKLAGHVVITEGPSIPSIHAGPPSLRKSPSFIEGQ